MKATTLVNLTSAEVEDAVAQYLENAGVVGEGFAVEKSSLCLETDDEGLVLGAEVKVAKVIEETAATENAEEAGEEALAD